jgi:hypothetical protein
MPNLTKTQVKQNLLSLQSKIEQNTSARTSFLKDPAAALNTAGVALTAERAKAINSFVDKQLKTPGARVSGASIRPSGAKNEVEVTVSVGVKF